MQYKVMKDYKKILEGVVNIINTTEKSDIGFANICTYIGENCPELVESEDEKIRKDLLIWLKDKQENPPIGFSTTKMEQWISWLEKKGDSVKYYEDKIVPKFTFNDVLALQCAMETANKIQNDKELYEQLVSLHNRIHDIYHLEKQGHKKTTWDKEDEENMNKVLYIFNQLKDTSSYKKNDITEKTIIDWFKSFKNRFSNDEYNKEMLGAIEYSIKHNRPLEKEHIAWFAWLERQVRNQSSIRERYDRIKNSEWFKKTHEGMSVSEEEEERKPAWSEEDEKMFISLKTLLDDASCYSCTEGADKILSWIKSFKDRVHPKQEWSEEDEIQFDRICKTLWKNRKGDTDEIYQQEQDIDWLKSLKDRVKPQPKQEWDEEDEKMLKSLCIIVHSQRLDKVITLKEESDIGKWIDKWLNHNPQPHWKPSKEQMKALDRYVNYLDEGDNEDAGIIGSLCRDLKLL